MASDKCRLHEANNLEAWCTRDQCIFWRLIESQDEEISNSVGCGLQHFNMIDSMDPEMARWLLEVKKQLENTDPLSEKSRITFRRREK